MNAAQSIPKEHAEHHRITVVLRREDARAVVDIRDTGRGMSRAQIEPIFEPFFTTRGRQGGTGLLSPSKRNHRRARWDNPSDVCARARKHVHSASLWRHELVEQRPRPSPTRLANT